MVYKIYTEWRKKYWTPISTIDDRCLPLPSPDIIGHVGTTIYLCLCLIAEGVNVQEKLRGIMPCECCIYKNAANIEEKYIDKNNISFVSNLQNLLSGILNLQRKCTFKFRSVHYLTSSLICIRKFTEIILRIHGT